MYVLDRRNNVRHRAWFPVEVGDAAGSAGLSVVQNLSHNGVLLAARKRVEIGSSVELNLHFNPEHEPPTRVTGKVVRAETNEADPRGLWPVRLAVAFDEPDPSLVATALGVN